MIYPAHGIFDYIIFMRLNSVLFSTKVNYEVSP